MSDTSKSCTKNTYLVHYAEIGLKGRNRPAFERQLMKNVRRQHGVEVTRRLPGRIAVESERALDLGNVFGIAWWTKAWEMEADVDQVEAAAVQLAQGAPTGCESFAMRAKVVDKRFGYSSSELEVRLGQTVKDATGLKVDLDQPDLRIYVEVILPEAFVYTARHPGPGGLPVGTAGKVMGLLSGGVDSAVAAYLMAKRGAWIELLHFYALPSAEEAHEGKIGEVARQLSRYLPGLVVHYAPYHAFQLATAEIAGRLQREELVAFRRFMAMTGQGMAEKRRAQALFTGDSLGQVASQTLENLLAVHDAVGMPIFRPVIAYDKVEIIDFAKQVGLYEPAIVPYKDCCSLMARSPATKAKLAHIRHIEEKIEIGRLVEQTLSEVVSHRYGPPSER